MNGAAPRASALVPLDAATFAADPLEQFQAWFVVAQSGAVPEPEAMALATATAKGIPSVRMVLLKGVDSLGFRFFTHYDSRKGRELAGNPRAALVFYWGALGRQVRIEGRVDSTSAAESDEYFATRPEGSRFAAAASTQGELVADRAELETRVARLKECHPGGAPPRPERWGGFRLIPDRVEFWQQGFDRLHDRLRYRREGSGWVIERLAP